MASQGNKRSRAGKSAASASAPALAPARWPRAPGTPFELPEHWRPTAMTRARSLNVEGHFHRVSSDEWLPYHSVFYNGLLNVTFEPTRFLDQAVLEQLGIWRQTSMLMRNMGLGVLAFEQHPLYTDLARQFLATAEVAYDADGSAAGRLTFFCHGTRYSISLDDLAELFCMDTDEQVRGFESTTLGRLTCFWGAIAFGELTQADMKISRIRHPVLRIAAKALGHTFFAKKESGSVRQDELMLLLLGLGDGMIESAGFRGLLGEIRRVHMGAYFAEILSQRKYKGLGSAKEERIESIGSLLTPIMRHCGVELPDELLDTKKACFIDDQYLANARICRFRVYQWIAEGGVAKFCKLPKPAWTYLSTWEQVRFELPATEQCSQSGAPLGPRAEPEQDFPAPPPASRRATAGPSGHSSAAGQFCVHGTPFPASEPVAEDLTDEYYATLAPLPAEATFEEWRAHTTRIQHEQTGILRRILRGLSRLSWTPPPACCSAPEDVHHPAPSPVPSVPAEMSGGSGESSGSSSSRQRRRRRLD